MYRYITTISMLFVFASCFNVKKLSNRISINKEYTGWYIGTSNAHFFVIEKHGSLKRNVAFMLPEYPPNCRPIGITDSFFVHKNEKKNDGMRYLIIGDNDSVSFNQDVSISRAKAFLREAEIGYRKDVNKQKSKVLQSIASSDGVFFIKAEWIDCYSNFRNIILFSNYSKDSAKYRNCDRISDNHSN